MKGRGDCVAAQLRILGAYLLRDVPAEEALEPGRGLVAVVLLRQVWAPFGASVLLRSFSHPVCAKRLSAK
eukprot:11198510-Lingulodinium_polyedra.AAC.1